MKMLVRENKILQRTLIFCVGCFEYATVKYSCWIEPPEALITLSINILIRIAAFKASIS